jgi:hypothetical protein
MSELPPSVSGTAAPAALYVNGARIDYTRWDMTVDLLLVTPTGEIPAEPGKEPEYATERMTRVIMSPMHAKAWPRASARPSGRGRLGSERFPPRRRNDCE